MVASEPGIRALGSDGKTEPGHGGAGVDRGVIRLSVPGALEFRDVAVRVVGTACRLLRPPRATTSSNPPASNEPLHPPRADFTQDEFATQVVSAFSECFNNLAIHGYKDAGPADDTRIEIELCSEEGALVIRVVDSGSPFDPAGYLELPDELPERGMGLFIIRSFMDEVSYEKGPPHTLTLKKLWPSAPSEGGGGGPLGLDRR